MSKLKQWMNENDLTQEGLGRKFKPPITQGAVGLWIRKNHIPVARVLELERITGIPRHEWRPDIYPRT